MIDAEEFKRRVTEFAGREFCRKSILSIRNGAGVIEHILGSGKYRRILEIGTYRGVGSAFMSQFVDGIVTIDLKYGKMEQDGQRFDRVRFFEAMGVLNVDCRLVENDAEKAEIIRKLPFDFAFIDGDHTAPAPANDFSLVKKCGTVLFHDYDANNDVMKFVDTLPRHQVEIMDMFALWRERPD